jgi:uncharacterized membrane protein
LDNIFNRLARLNQFVSSCTTLCDLFPRVFNIIGLHQNSHHMENLIKVGRWFFAISLIGLAGQQMYYGDFRPVFVPPAHSPIPGQAFLAYLFSIVLIGAAVALLLEKWARTAMLLLGGLFLALVLLCHIPYELFVDPYSKSIGPWANAIKELQMAGGAFVIAGSFPNGHSAGPRESAFLRPLEALIPLGSIFYSIMMIIFGIEHFIYAEFVKTLIPSWIPGSLFWTYFAGIALIGSGVGIILQFKLKLMGILNGTMIFIWFLVLHIPRAIVAPASDKGNELTSVFESLGCSGVAFVIAFGYGVWKLSKRTAPI